MFSELGPLFKTVFREAESTDTRQAIRRDEKKENRRQQEFQKNESAPEELWLDSMSVSVDALKAFLINFLKSLPGESTPSSGTAKGIQAINPEHHEPASTMAARAASAYRSMAEQTHHTPPPIPEEAISASHIAANAVSSGEVRIMHQLIDDLETLSRGDVRYLTIEKADTFLESLINAVSAAKR